MLVLLQSVMVSGCSMVDSLFVAVTMLLEFWKTKFRFFFIVIHLRQPILYIVFIKRINNMLFIRTFF